MCLQGQLVCRCTLKMEWPFKGDMPSGEVCNRARQGKQPRRWRIRGRNDFEESGNLWNWGGDLLKSVFAFWVKITGSENGITSSENLPFRPGWHIRITPNNRVWSCYLEKYIMEKIVLNKVIRCDKDETEVEFIVRGHRVIGLFPATPKLGVYQNIRSILIASYIRNNSVGNLDRFWQNPQNMR